MFGLDMTPSKVLSGLFNTFNLKKLQFDLETWLQFQLVYAENPKV